MIFIEKSIPQKNIKQRGEKMKKLSAKYMLKYIDYFRRDDIRIYAIEEKDGFYYSTYDKTFIQFEEDFRNSELIDYNFKFIINKLNNFQDTLYNLIPKCDYSVLKVLFTYYIMIENERDGAWIEEIENKTFLKLLLRLQELLEGKKSDGIDYINIEKKSGIEVFKYNNNYLPYTLKDFWSFQYSNLISSKVRDDISKFIVAKALNITDRKFEYFDGHDLTSKEGIPIEVRSASYITPLGENPSKEIEFNIYKNGDTKKIYGFIYIFCLLSHRSKEGLDPLDINQWEFYVTTKSNLEKILNGNEKITLKKLILNNAIESEYENLYKDVIKLCLKEIRNNKR